jgi:hypothetical protein
MSLFISTAHASAAAPAPAGGGMEMLIMLGVFGLVFIFNLPSTSEACKRA